MPPPPIPLGITPAQPTAVNLQRATMPHHDFAASLSKTPSSATITRKGRPDANIASFEASQISPVSPSGLVHPASDLIFFTDRRVKADINEFWGNPAGSNDFTGFGNEAQPALNINTTYNNADDFIPRYDPATDDIKIFQEHGERIVKEREEGEKREGVSEMRERQLQQIITEVERFRKG